MPESKPRAPRNRTLKLSQTERVHFADQLLTADRPLVPEQLQDRVLQADVVDVLPLLPSAFVDLLILDPPYNLSKDYNTTRFQQCDDDDYRTWLESWLPALMRALKPTASVYACSDWRSSSALYAVLKQHLIVRNRITWERDKGRGARRNWKNNSEDIWFCTVGETYIFEVDRVKLKRQVRAPYRDGDGQPRDWQQEGARRYRLTHPANLWTDITVPFWSMPENTDHPAQKPEKLFAKLILASTDPGALVFDPFLGSGTSAVVARKLGRHFCGIELDRDYACLALKRLALAEADDRIQGYEDGVFWERNSRLGER